MKTGLRVVPCAVVISLTACQTPPYCPELGSCGGDVLQGGQDTTMDGIVDKEWAVSGNDSCMDEVAASASPVSLARQPAKPAGERPIERTFPDWCSNVTLKQDGTIAQFDAFYTMLKQNEGWFPTIPIDTGTIMFSADGRYEVRFTQDTAQRLQLSASCLTAQGIALDCPAFAPHLQTFMVDQMQRLKNADIIDGRIVNVVCGASTQGGCLCDYDMWLTGGPRGRWVTKGTTITFFDDQFRPPSTADYCVKGDTLEITARDQTRLFNRPNLRSVRLRPPSCNDGSQSRSLGEQGMDCGGSCGTACPAPTCTDGFQNGQETSLDCGGPAGTCDPCPMN
jgi:hypothetical protein